MSTIQAPDVQERSVTDNETEWVLPRKVVVHNCVCHSFDQVIHSLMKTLDLSHESAEQFATLVHLTGAAVVYEGELERCELIAKTIVAWAGPGQRTKLPLKVTVEE